MDAYSVGRGALRRSIRLCALSAGLAALVAAASPVRAQAEPEPEPEPEWTVLTVAQSGNTAGQGVIVIIFARGFNVWT